MKISDRDLDRLGSKFMLKKILIRLNVNFEQYLYKPEHYDNIIRFMDKNKKAEIVEACGEHYVVH
jgi:hypothetical protein